MEQNTQTPLFDFSVTYDMGNHLRETARWCRFISIVGFIFLICMLVGALAAGGTLSPMLSQFFPGSGELLKSIFYGVVLVFLLVGGIFVFLIYRFSALTKKAIQLNDQQLFNQGLRSLKLYFIIYGVFALLSILANVFTFSRVIFQL